MSSNHEKIAVCLETKVFSIQTFIASLLWIDIEKFLHSITFECIIRTFPMEMKNRIFTVLIMFNF